ncbi:hypothetical protein Tco_0699868 [Tanacetum coccineum]
MIKSCSSCSYFSGIDAHAPKIIKELFKIHIQNTILNVHPSSSTLSASIPDLQQQLYLKMKLDAFLKIDHDDHLDDDALPRGEKSLKRQKTSRGSKSTRGSSSKQPAKDSNTSAFEQPQQQDYDAWVEILRNLNDPPRRHFKTLSLDELRSHDFNLLSDQEYSEEEVAETMAETMEQYMSKTRVDYGSGVARPKIEGKDNFELKGQFLKELRTNTFSGSDHENANEHIKKVREIVDLFHILNITIDQVMLRSFPMSLTRAASRWLRNEPTGSITTWDDENLFQAWERFKELLMKCPQHYLTEMHEVIMFYNGLGIPTRQILDSRGAIPSKTAADAKIAIQEMAEYSQKWHNGTSQEVLKLLID